MKDITSSMKVAQTLAFFIQEGQTDKSARDTQKPLKLLKYIWAADRFSLRTFGNTLSGDHYLARPCGPIAVNSSRFLDACAISGSVKTQCASAHPHDGPDSQTWRRFFEINNEGDIVLREAPGVGMLSKADFFILEKTYEHFRSSPAFHVDKDISHIYPEWKDADPTTGRIELEKFFEDPYPEEDPYFHTDAETMESARYFFEERKQLFREIGIPLSPH